MKLFEHWAIFTFSVKAHSEKSPYVQHTGTATLPTREEEAPSHGRNEETIMPALI